MRLSRWGRLIRAPVRSDGIFATTGKKSTLIRAGCNRPQGKRNKLRSCEAKGRVWIMPPEDVCAASIQWITAMVGGD